MAREMKLGIAVIGLLLVVFCGLLVKRMTRPSKLPLTSISSETAASSANGSTKQANALVRPTQVTPQTGASKASQSAWATSRAKSASDDSDWKKPQDHYAATVLPPVSTSNETNHAPNTQPKLLTASTPIQDLEGRTANVTAKTGNSANMSSTPERYQTGYGATADSAATKPQAAPIEPVTTAAPTAPADPFRAMESSSRQASTPSATETSARYGGYGSSNYSGNYDSNYSRNYSNLQSNATATDYQSVQATDSTPAEPNANYQTPSSGSLGASNYSTNSRSSLGSSRSDLPSDASTSYAAATQGDSSYKSLARPAAASTSWEGTSVAADSGAPIPSATMQRSGEKYAVQPNDTFWAISEKAYGTGAFFKALYEYNRKRHKQADELVVGQELLVPEESVLRRSYPDLCPRPKKVVGTAEQRMVSVSSKLRNPGRVYKVVEGDTLFEIARYELGKSSRWAEIYDLNRDVLGDDFDYLRPGTELILPTDMPRNESITRQPSEPRTATPFRY